MKTPLNEEEVRRLRIGEIIYLNGEIFASRDEGHIRAMEYIKDGRAMPVDLRDSVLYHCGPVVKKNDEWEIVSAGPTTSARMDQIQPEFIRKFGVRAIIGKGGMGPATIETMREYGCIYLAATGGVGALTADHLRVCGVYWLDLGIPEALWVLKADCFGPLMVAIDAHGKSLYERVEEEIKKNVAKIKRELEI